MTTHPPGHPSGPTGPGRFCGSRVEHEAHPWSDYGMPMHCDGLGEQLPRLGEVIRDTERLLAQALHVLSRDIDPAALPGGDPDRSRWYLQDVALNIAAAQRGLGRLAAAHLPPVGSAVKLPARSPAEVETERIDRGGFNPHTEVRVHFDGTVDPDAFAKAVRDVAARESARRGGRL